jgi:hypothetical protein
LGQRFPFRFGRVEARKFGGGLRRSPHGDGWQRISRRPGAMAYLKNDGRLEEAAQMANHASTRATWLYDRRRDELSLNGVERIRV